LLGGLSAQGHVRSNVSRSQKTAWMLRSLHEAE